MSTTLTATLPDERRTLADAELLTLKSRESGVVYLADDGETLVEGTLRSGWFTAEGDPGDLSVNFRHRYVRITTITGGERYVKFDALADRLARHDLAAR